jgi:hypothetical protein
VATRNRTQERPRREWCLKNPVPAVATTSLEDFSKGGAGPMTHSEKKLSLVARKWIYSFNCRKAKKLIPVER